MSLAAGLNDGVLEMRVRRERRGEVKYSCKVVDPTFEQLRVNALQDTKRPLP